MKGSPSALAFAPGLLLIGLGVGVKLTPSVNVVRSAFPEELHGEISGLSRSVSNLGSSPGAAVAGTILVSGIGDKSYAAAMIVLAYIGIVGLVATMSIPAQGVHAVACARLLEAVAWASAAASSRPGTRRA